MAILFGDREDFAIEAGVEPGLEPPSQVWGHMCVWCRGVPLGNLASLHCGLSHAHDSFRWLAAHVDELWAAKLTGLDDAATWNFLDGLLYGYHGVIELPDDRTIEQCVADSEEWGRFDFLTNWDEPFDGYKAFILCPPGGPVRVLSRNLPPEMGQSLEVSRTALVEVSKAFAHWFEEQETRLCSRELRR